MRNIKLTALILFGFFLLCGPASALTISGGTDVGDLDEFLIAGDFNPSDAEQLKFIQDYLGKEYYIVEKYDVQENDWEKVVGENDYYALQLLYEPSHFLIKLGTGGTDIESNHRLYQNLASLAWAVVDIAKWGDIESINIGRVSHIAEIKPIPEPTTMLLLGMGLLGVGLVSRKKFLNR